MAEHQPSTPEAASQVASPETPEIRDKKLQLEFAMAELERAQRELAVAQGEMNFGKFDATVPNEGEHTYSSYLEQRPTEADVEEQKLTGQEYYDHKYNLVNEGERKPYAHMTMEELRKERIVANETNDSRTEHEIRGYLYEQMGVVELAKEAANARQSSDAQEEQRIREALEHHLTMDAMQDDSKSAEKAQADYNDDVANFDKLVDRFLARGQAKNAHAADAHEKPKGEGQPSGRTDDAEKKADDAAEQKEAKQDDRTYGGYFKGTRVSVAESTPHPTDSSKDMLTVVGEDGRVRRILASDFTQEPVATKEKTAPEPPQPDKGPNNGFTIPARDLEGEPVVVGEGRVVYQEGTEANASEKQNRLNKFKAWFKDKLPDFQKNAGRTTWRERWAKVQSGFGPKDRVLDHEVTDEMSSEEKEERRKKHRVALLAGGAAVLATGALIFGLGQDKDASNLFENEPSVSDTPSPEASDPPKEKEPVVPANDGSRWNEGDLSGNVELSDPIPLGGGGEELFKGLGMDASAWYKNEDAILEQLPGEFYRMNDGHVGIANPGQLSQEAQNFIKTLQ